MRTVRRLLWRDVGSAVGFVALAFLALFFFIDFIEELERLRRGQPPWHAAWLGLLNAPSNFYEVFPIAVLIGAVFALARLAQSSEFTILRTGGLGPGRALGLLSLLGLLFALLTFAVGDWLAPWADQRAQQAKAEFSGGVLQRAGGAWLKDRQRDANGREHWFTVHVQAASLDGRLAGVRLFEFDEQGRLLSRWEAAWAQVDRDGRWVFENARRTAWPAESAPAASVNEQATTKLVWQGGLSIGVVNAAMLKANQMSTLELYRYKQHLTAQEQAAQRYEIQFWRKALYPFACLVMMALALPFAYLHARAGGISARVFIGIMLGISFVLLNNLASHVGLLQDWSPFAVAMAPSLLYLLLSMTAFGWLVRYR